MDDYTKFNNQTAGRDKLFRLIQYTSRILWYNLEKRNKDANTVNKIKKVDEILGLMRRLLRFGRFFEVIHSALPLFSSVTNPVIRFCMTMSRISSGCYMLFDHIVCLQKLGIISLKQSVIFRMDKMSSKFWLYSILLGIIRDVYELLQIRKEYKAQNHLQAPRACLPPTRSLITNDRKTGHSALNQENAKMEAEVASTIDRQKQGNFQNVQKCIRRLKFFANFACLHADVTVDSSKNICDLFIPLSSLGYVKLSPSIISFLGVISTILSTLPILYPTLKMVPSA